MCTLIHIHVDIVFIPAHLVLTNVSFACDPKTKVATSNSLHCKIHTIYCSIDIHRNYIYIIAGSFKSQLIDYFSGHIVSWEAFGRFMLIRTK